MDVVNATGSDAPSKLEQLLTAGTVRKTVVASSPATAATSFVGSSGVNVVDDQCSSSLSLEEGDDGTKKTLKVVLPRLSLRFRSSGDNTLSGSVVQDGTGTSVQMDPGTDKHKNPRKRLLNAVNTTGEGPSQDEAVKTKKASKVAKWKSDNSNNGEEDNSQSQCNGSVQTALTNVNVDGKNLMGQTGDANTVNNQDNAGPKGIIDTDQIEKLLNMPSPKNNWKSVKRVRAFPCDQCPKSYSTQLDLKSHILSHSANEVKIFGCDFCDKRFKWIASLNVHVKKAHECQSSPTRPDMDDTSYNKTLKSSASSSSSSSRRLLSVKGDQSNVSSQREKSSNSKTTFSNPESATGTLSSATNGLENDRHYRENVKVPINVRKKLQIDYNESTMGKHMKKKTPPLTFEGSASTNKMQHSVSNTKKIQKDTSTPVTKKVKERARTPESEKMQHQAKRPPTPPTPGGRSALRRNIQRPKWLTDTDLVTDYEFPKGTNSVRSSPSASSSASSSTVGTKSDKTESRRTSLEAFGKSLTASKTKSEGGNKKNMEGFKTVSMKRKRESGRQVEVPSRKASLDTKSGKNSGQLQSGGGDTSNRPQSPSPTKELRDQILTLSLSTLAGSSTLKNGRKRPSETVPDNNNAWNHKVKKIKTTKKSAKVQSSSKAGDNSKTKPINNTSDCVQLNRSQIELPVPIEEQKDKRESTVKNEHLLDTSNVEKQHKMDVEARKKDSANITPVASNSLHDVKSEGSCDLHRQNEVQSGAQQSKEHERNEGNRAIFGEVNEKKLTTVPIEFLGGIGDTSRQMNHDRTNNYVLPSASENSLLSMLCKDEDMPILKPQTSSSSASRTEGSPAPPDVTITQNTVDDQSVHNLNGNASSTPYEAPVLFKAFELESDTGMENSLIADTNTEESIQENIRRHSAENVLSSAADELNKLPMIDDDAIARSRRDRSDSLSMRSCGSGSQSEKLQGLAEDTTVSAINVKDAVANALLCNEHLDSDSDSNESLLSEFSELAAQVSEKTDAVKFKEDCLRFISTKISANSMWAIRKELKSLKKEKKYFKFGKLSPLAAGLMHDLFCQPLE